jgi:hypothetical protein
MVSADGTDTRKHSRLRPLPATRERCRPVSVGSLVEKVLSHPRLQRRFLQEKVFRDWEKVVGEGLLNKCRPLRIKGETLQLEVKSSAWAHQLIYEQEEIVSRVNALAGEMLVTGIHCRIARGGRLPPPQSKAERVSAAPIDYAALVGEQERERWRREIAGRIKDPELAEILLRLRCRSLGRYRARKRKAP